MNISSTKAMIQPRSLASKARTLTEAFKARFESLVSNPATRHASELFDTFLQTGETPKALGEWKISNAESEFRFLAIGDVLDSFSKQDNGLLDLDTAVGGIVLDNSRDGFEGVTDIHYSGSSKSGWARQTTQGQALSGGPSSLNFYKEEAFVMTDDMARKAYLKVTDRQTELRLFTIDRHTMQGQTSEGLLKS